MSRPANRRQHSKNWLAYLQTSFKSDPVGRRYARALVLRLKFELGVGVAAISAALGLIWLAFLGLKCSVFIAWMVVCIAFTAWGLVESKETHKLLSKTRATILDKVHTVE